MTRRIFALQALLSTLAIASSATASPRSAEFTWYASRLADDRTGVHLYEEGAPYFSLNELLLPTYTRELQDFNAVHYAPFRTSLFRLGTNDILFGVGAHHPEGTHLRHQVFLTGSTDTPILLFDVLIKGQNYVGATDIEVTLDLIDPDLSQHLETFRRGVAETIARLFRLAPEADGAGAEAERLRTLRDEVDELIERGFDQIDIAELESILSRYADIVPGLFEVLRQVIEDVRVVIEDLRSEMQRIVGEYRDWSSRLADGASGAPPFEHVEFEPDPDGSLPPVDVPDVLGDDEFDDENDPYDRYADEVIAQLRSTLDQESGTINRASFLTIFAAWRSNIEALNVGLVSRAVVSQREWAAFIASQNKVLAFTDAYITSDGWFRDLPYDPEIRQLVDVSLRRIDLPRAERIKAALNLQQRMGPSEATAAFAIVFTLHEYGLAVQNARRAQLVEELERRRTRLWDSAIFLLESAASIGWEAAVALTPLGDVIDVCEALTGKEGCNVISGADLSWERRAFAAAGLLIWGSPAAIHRLARKVDRACGTGLVGVAVAGIRCGAAQFFARLDAAIENVGGPKKPRQSDSRPPDPNPDGSVMWTRTDGTQVLYNPRGLPEFNANHYYGGARQPEVWVPFHCHRDQEFAAANAANGWPRDGQPSDMRWHHSHRFENRDGVVHILMQAVKEDVHSWAKHAGGIAIGKQILGADACR